MNCHNQPDHLGVGGYWYNCESGGLVASALAMHNTCTDDAWRVCRHPRNQTCSDLRLDGDNADLPVYTCAERCDDAADEAQDLFGGSLRSRTQRIRCRFDWFGYSYGDA
jgi:hypothetical protein